MKAKKENGGVTELLSFVTDKAMQLAKENAMFGEPIEKNGLTIIPVSHFSVSFAGGGVDSLSNTKQTPAGGGAKVSLIPMSFLVIDGANVRTVNIQTPLQAKVTEIIDNVIDSVTNKDN